MLCLSDSIRHDDPCVQQLLRTIEEAPTLAQLILAVWPLARVLARQVGPAGAFEQKVTVLQVRVPSRLSLVHHRCSMSSMK
jgi:hypothetical protein